MDDILDKLKKRLADRDRMRIVDNTLVSAAVLVPVFFHDNEYHLLFTKRTDRLRDHKGQICFPGGRCEDCDESSLETALRESFEEIGLDPEKVDIIGALDDKPTMHTNYLITPYTGYIPWPADLTIDPVEVARIITVPVSALLKEDALKPEDDPLNDGTSEGFFYYRDGNIIWGATARVLKQFLELWSETDDRPS